MDRLPVIVQRTESLAVAAFVLVLGVQLGFAWWWPIVLFLAFDLSMVGYARSPRAGALVYDAVHSYLGPALFGAIGILADLRWALLLSLAWAFHVAGDRALGYGLKFTDRFTHTHLGEIGHDRQATTVA